MSALARDMRRAARSLRKNSGFAFSVILASATGIGIGTPLLGIVLAAGLGASPYTDPLVDGGRHATDWLHGWTAARQSIPQIQGEALEVLLAVLLALTVLFLAIALINVFTLLLAAATARRSELALRAALGAVRWRLIGHLVAEGTLLLIVAGGIGLGIGVAVAFLLDRSWPGDSPPWDRLVVDGRILMGIGGGFIVLPLLAWLSPVEVAWRRDLRRFLTTGGRSTAGRNEVVTRQALVVAQIAASLVLLTGAGLLLRGFASSAEDGGQPRSGPRETLTVEVRLPESEEWSTHQRQLFHGAARSRIAALAGVVDTSVATTGTWVGLGPSDLVHALTGNPQAPGRSIPARYHAVSPGFFQASGVRVLHGREFETEDGVAAPPVAVVNRAFVGRFRLVGNGPGRSLQLHGPSFDGAWYTIVGVVDDVRPEGLGNGTEPVPKVYLSTIQHPPRVVGLAVRTTGDPMRLLPAVREIVHSLAPEVTLTNAMTMEQYLTRFRAPLRWFAALFAVLAGVALVLAASGLYGAMSHNVTRRTREIGIRMALGAGIADIMRLVLGQSLRITTMGVVLGLFGVLPLARVLQLLLSGVEPFDALLFSGTAVVLGGVALLSSYRPARRAASVEPQISLQAE